MDDKEVQFKVIVKGSDEQCRQIHVISNAIEIGNRDVSGHQLIVLSANGGEQMYEYEVHRNYAEKRNSYGKRHRED